jgi:hypothetical protein
MGKLLFVGKNIKGISWENCISLVLKKLKRRNGKGSDE